MFALNGVDHLQSVEHSVYAFANTDAWDSRFAASNLSALSIGNGWRSLLASGALVPMSAHGDHYAYTNASGHEHHTQNGMLLVNLTTLRSHVESAVQIVCESAGGSRIAA